jgi:hypothetical protein
LLRNVIRGWKGFEGAKHYNLFFSFISEEDEHYLLKHRLLVSMQ